MHPRLPEMTCGFLIQLVFCPKKMWFFGVEVEQETSAPPPKKKSWIRSCGFLIQLGRPSKLVVCGGGGQCTPYKGLYGEGMTDRGTFIRLQVYEKARIRKKWVVLGVRLPKMSRATAHTVSTVVVPMVPAGAV